MSYRAASKVIGHVVRRTAVTLATVTCVTAGALANQLIGAPAAHAAPLFVAAAASPAGGGWRVTATGNVVPFGGAPDLGSITFPLAAPVVAMASTRDGGGYWLAASNGGVFSFGDARFMGSMGGVRLGRPVVAMASTPDGGGYWLAASGGGVFSFGDARFFGSMGGVRLGAPVVAMTSTPDGRGYWLAASNGGLFSFGDARFFGSMGGVRLGRPVVAMASTPDGSGYWLASSGGGVFSFGGARYEGSLGGIPGVTVAAALPAAGGYSLVQATGAVVPFGDRPSPSAAGGTKGPNPTKVPPVTTTTSVPPVTTTTSLPPVTTTTSVPPVTTTTSVPPVTTTTSVPPVTTTTVPPAPPPAPGMALGVMEADPQWMSADQAAGVTEAMLNVSWSQLEPQPGVFNLAAVANEARIADQYRANGWTVAVDVGLQSPPAWVASLPDGQLVDQNGHVAGSGTPDYEYSAAVRAAASTYITEVVTALGPVSSYRIGLGGNGEMMYPDTSSNQWWAYAADAQKGGADLPASVGVSPMPGWVPGSSAWNGSPVTASQVSSWYNWYFGALVDGLAWEMSSFRSAGFGGQLQLLMPGDGAVPALYNQRLAANLAPTAGDGYYTMNTGVVWWRMFDALASKVSLNGAVVDITSVYDQSGSPRGSNCQATDSQLTVSQADPWASGWSDTRYISYLAKTHGLPVIGENPGNTSPGDLSATIGLAQSCGLGALQWAWDQQLHSGSTGLASISQLAAAWSAAGL